MKSLSLKVYLCYSKCKIQVTMSDEDQIEYENVKVRCGNGLQLWIATDIVELLSLIGDF